MSYMHQQSFFKGGKFDGIIKSIYTVTSHYHFALRRTKVTMFVLFITQLIGQVLSTLTRNV